MGTSDGYAGSGGAWSGMDDVAEDFAANPTDEQAEQLVNQALQALNNESEQSGDGDESDGGEPDLPPPFVPTAGTLPGVRVRAPSGGGGGGASGGGGARGGGGRTRTSGSGGGRSRARTSQAGGRAIAAGRALRAGDAAALDALGLSLADLEGLSEFDQVKRILDATVPASGSPQESEVRRAASKTLIALLKDGDDSPRAAVETFVCEYVFHMIVTEHGERFNHGDKSGTNVAKIEARLKGAIRAYTSKVEFPDGVITARDFQGAIDSVLKKAEALVP
jgi:hypothetical protein